MDWNQRQVLVTGGGSGIGREMVIMLHAMGARVATATLDPAELDSLQAELGSGPGEFIPIQMDLTADDAVEALIQQLDDLGFSVEVLVNNAGTGLLGNHTELDTKSVRKALTLNIQVVTELVALVARRMIENGVKGHILNVASIGGYVPVPKLAAYAGSKHYVIAFTHALADELAPHGIYVGMLCPGITRTKIYDAMGLSSEQHSRGSISSLADLVAMDATQVAECGVRAIEKRQRVALPGWNKLVPASALFPQQFVSRMLHGVVGKRSAR